MREIIRNIYYYYPDFVGIISIILYSTFLYSVSLNAHKREKTFTYQS